MKKISTVIVILASCFFMQQCTNSGVNGNPKDTLIAFFENLSKNDIEGARKYATAHSKSMLDMMEMGMKAAGGVQETSKFNKSKMDFSDAVIKGDNATVIVKEKGSGDSVNFPLKKEGGAWKVAFDMETMVQIGMDKTKQQNPGGEDSLQQQMKNLKKMNLDSIKDLIQSRNGSPDSLKNVIKK